MKEESEGCWLWLGPTQILNQLEAALESMDTHRSKSWDGLLSEKADVLLKLITELMKMMEEEKLEVEMEHADIAREKIDLAIHLLAIISIHEAIVTPAISHRVIRLCDSEAQGSFLTGTESCPSLKVVWVECDGVTLYLIGDH